MSFYEDLRKEYMPWVSDLDFSDLINVFEVDYGADHPEWYDLPEVEQDRKIGEAFKLKYGK